MPQATTTDVATEAHMLELGERFAERLTGNELVWLEGALGAGKTTFARGVLRGLGFKGHVKSPTYTLVEPYEFEGHRVYHLDLYRIVDPAELEYIGIDEILAETAVKLVEWPERAGTRLPAPAAVIRIRVTENGRTVESIVAD